MTRNQQYKYKMNKSTTKITNTMMTNINEIFSSNNSISIEVIVLHMYHIKLISNTQSDNFCHRLRRNILI
jgi:hypothetical protein